MANNAVHLAVTASFTRAELGGPAIVAASPAAAAQAPNALHPVTGSISRLNTLCAWLTRNALIFPLSIDAETVRTLCCRGVHAGRGSSVDGRKSPASGRTQACALIIQDVHNTAITGCRVTAHSVLLASTLPHAACNWRAPINGGRARPIPTLCGAGWIVL